MKILKTVTLTNTRHGHAKEYEAVLVSEGKTFFVDCAWGKIGGRKNKLRKGPFFEVKAVKVLNALVAAKKSDGYMEDKAKQKTGPKVKRGRVILEPEPEFEQHFGLPLFYPMKAVEAPREALEEFLDDPKWFAEEKFDGSRYFLKVNPDGEVALHSRKVSVKNNLPVDRTGNVPHLIKEMQLRLKKMPPIRGLILDGEIMWDRGSVISIMGSLPEKAIRRQKETVWTYFQVYDLPFCDGDTLFDTPYKERLGMLKSLLGVVADGHIRLTPSITKNKRELLQKIWAAGGEGIILKNPEGLYQPGDRPKNVWIKVKAKLTDEFVVMGFKPGQGKYKGQVGAIIFGQYNRRGKLVEVSQCSGFTDEVRTEITKNKKKFKGKVVEVEFQERTNKEAGRRNVESLRHPRFMRWRDDKAAKDCKLP